jgi:hypothetical protein
MNLSQMMADDLASELNRVAGYGCIDDYLKVVLGHSSDDACMRKQKNGVRVLMPTPADNDTIIAIDTARHSVTVSRPTPDGKMEYGESPLCQDTVKDVDAYVQAMH